MGNSFNSQEILIKTTKQTYQYSSLNSFEYFSVQLISSTAYQLSLIHI